MTGIVQDVRLAARWLVRRPGLAATAITSLALGIGASTAVFSLIDALLYRPFPVYRSEELVSVVSEKQGETQDLSAPDYRDLRREQQVLTDLAAHATLPFSVQAGTETERLSGEFVSSNYFHVLGVAPRPGRGFLPGEDESPAPVAVISQRLWRNRYAGAVDAVGSTIRVDGRELTIVGVAPEGFRGITLVPQIDLWLPISMLPEWPAFLEFFDRRDIPWLSTVGRLRPGVRLASADAEMRVVARSLELAYPETNRGRTARVVPFDETRLADRGSVISFLGLSFAVVFSVLLIACINVAGLRLAESYGREAEISIRTALGASRWRIARGLFAENLLIYGCAFAGSLLVAHLSLRLLERLTLFQMALADVDLRVDGRVVPVALGVTLLGAAAGSLVPQRISLPGRGSRLTPAVSRLQRAFVVVQVALSSALLVGAGLLARTLQKVYAIDPGFRTESVLFASVDLQSMEFRYDENRARQFYRDVLERVSALPGVRSAAWSADTPFERFTILTLFVPEEKAASGEPDWIQVDADIVTPGFLRTMGIELVAGRDFLESDDESTPGVVLVNETMARTYWPGESAVGRRIRAWSRRGIRHDVYQVIGVVRDVKVRTLWEEPRPYLYYPLAQRFFQRMNLHVHTAGPPMSLLPAVREVIRSLDDDLPLFDARPLSEERAILLARQRSVGVLLGLSALLSLVLAAVGTYGMTSQHVARRVPEVGLRVALGARRGDVAWWVARQGLLPVVIGVGLGLALATEAGALVESLLIGVALRDVPSFVLTGVILLGASGVACALPARRAIRIDPAAALRSE